MAEGLLLTLTQKVSVSLPHLHSSLIPYTCVCVHACVRMCMYKFCKLNRFAFVYTQLNSLGAVCHENAKEKYLSYVEIIVGAAKQIAQEVCMYPFNYAVE